MSLCLCLSEKVKMYTPGMLNDKKKYPIKHKTAFTIMGLDFIHQKLCLKSSPKYQYFLTLALSPSTLALSPSLRQLMKPHDGRLGGGTACGGESPWRAGFRHGCVTGVFALWLCLRVTEKRSVASITMPLRHCKSFSLSSSTFPVQPSGDYHSFNLNFNIHTTQGMLAFPFTH